jgi:hypothetical protein
LLTVSLVKVLITGPTGIDAHSQYDEHGTLC